MYQPPARCEIVFETFSHRQCLDVRLVLQAVGVRSKLVSRDRRWYLIVDEENAAEAREEITAYLQENPVVDEPAPERVPTYNGAFFALFAYVSVLVTIAVVEAPWGLQLDLFTPGRMKAQLVLEGEFWRTFTALTLHADAGHLISNLVFGCVLGLMAGRVLGGGVAWLVIVVAGALGNGMNALVQPRDHTSIGASTAVFAALGILVVHALRHTPTDRQQALKRWSPLIAGIVLLSLTGVGGPRTDVAAHVTGFLAGLLLGWLAVRLAPEQLRKPGFQTLTSTIALLLIAMSWIIALATA